MAENNYFENNEVNQYFENDHVVDLCDDESMECSDSIAPSCDVEVCNTNEPIEPRTNEVTCTSNNSTCIIEEVLSYPHLIYDNIIPPERIKIIKSTRPTPSLPKLIETYESKNGHTRLVQFDPILYDKYQWLTGCTHKQRLYCWPCLLISGSINSKQFKSLWNSDGNDTFFKKLKTHANTAAHLAAEIAYIHCMDIFTVKIDAQLKVENKIVQIICDSEMPKEIQRMLELEKEYLEGLRTDTPNRDSIKKLQNTENIFVTNIINKERLEIFKLGKPTPTMPFLKVDKWIPLEGKYVGLKKNLYSNHDWLAGCPTRNRLFCWPCVFFSEKRSAWSMEGSINCYDIEQHTRISRHKKLVKMYNQIEVILSDPSNVNVRQLRIHGDKIEIDNSVGEEADIEVVQDTSSSSQWCVEPLSSTTKPQNSKKIDVIGKLLNSNFEYEDNIITRKRLTLMHHGRPTPALPLLGERKNTAQKDGLCGKVSMSNRRFKIGQYEVTRWLTGCSKRSSLYCWPCLFFSTQTNCIWSRIGRKSIFQLKSGIENHEKTLMHLKSLNIFNQVDAILKDKGHCNLELKLVDETVEIVQEFFVSELHEEVDIKEESDDEMDGFVESECISEESNLYLEETSQDLLLSQHGENSIDDISTSSENDSVTSLPSENHPYVDTIESNTVPQDKSSLHQTENITQIDENQDLNQVKVPLNDEDILGVPSELDYEVDSIDCEIKPEIIPHIVSVRSGVEQELFESTQEIITHQNVNNEPRYCDIQQAVSSIQHDSSNQDTTPSVQYQSLPKIEINKALSTIQSELLNQKNDMTPTTPTLHQQDDEMIPVTVAETPSIVYTTFLETSKKKRKNKSKLVTSNTNESQSAISTAKTPPQNSKKIDVIGKLLNSNFEYEDNIITRKRLTLMHHGRPTPALPLLGEKKNTAQKDGLCGKVSMSNLRFKIGQYEVTPWLTGCSKRSSLYCWPCLLFSTQTNCIWNRIGRKSIFQLKSGIKQHEKRVMHLKSLNIFNQVDAILKDKGHCNLKLKLVDETVEIVQEFFVSELHEEVDIKEESDEEMDGFVESECISEESDLYLEETSQDLLLSQHGENSIDDISMSSENDSVTSLPSENHPYVDTIESNTVPQDESSLHQTENITQIDENQDLNQVKVPLSDEDILGVPSELGYEVDSIDCEKNPEIIPHIVSVRSGVEQELFESTQEIITHQNVNNEPRYCDIQQAVSSIQHDSSNQDTTPSVQYQSLPKIEINKALSTIQSELLNQKNDMTPTTPTLHQQNDEMIPVTVAETPSIVYTTFLETSKKKRKNKSKLVTSNTNESQSAISTAKTPVTSSSDAIETLLLTPFVHNNKSILAERLEIFKLGRPQPCIKTLKLDNGKPRFLTLDVRIYNNIRWIAGSSKSNALYCWPCLLFNEDKNMWNTKGTSYLKGLARYVSVHVANKYHIEALARYKVVENMINTSDNLEAIADLFSTYSFDPQVSKKSSNVTKNIPVQKLTSSNSGNSVNSSLMVNCPNQELPTSVSNFETMNYPRQMLPSTSNIAMQNNSGVMVNYGSQQLQTSSSVTSEGNIGTMNYPRQMLPSTSNIAIQNNSGVMVNYANQQLQTTSSVTSVGNIGTMNYPRQMLPSTSNIAMQNNSGVMVNYGSQQLQTSSSVNPVGNIGTMNYPRQMLPSTSTIAMQNNSGVMVNYANQQLCATSGVNPSGNIGTMNYSTQVLPVTSSIGNIAIHNNSSLMVNRPTQILPTSSGVNSVSNMETMIYSTQVLPVTSSIGNVAIQNNQSFMVNYPIQEMPTSSHGVNLVGNIGTMNYPTQVMPSTSNIGNITIQNNSRIMVNYPNQQLCTYSGVNSAGNIATINYPGQILPSTSNIAIQNNSSLMVNYPNQQLCTPSGVHPVGNIPTMNYPGQILPSTSNIAIQNNSSLMMNYPNQQLCTASGVSSVGNIATLNYPGQILPSASNIAIQNNSSLMVNRPIQILPTSSGVNPAGNIETMNYPGQILPSTSNIAIQNNSSLMVNHPTQMLPASSGVNPAGNIETMNYPGQILPSTSTIAIQNNSSLMVNRPTQMLPTSSGVNPVGNISTISYPGQILPSTSNIAIQNNSNVVVNQPTQILPTSSGVNPAGNIGTINLPTKVLSANSNLSNKTNKNNSNVVVNRPTPILPKPTNVNLGNPPNNCETTSSIALLEKIHKPKAIPESKQTNIQTILSLPPFQRDIITSEKYEILKLARPKPDPTELPAEYAKYSSQYDWLTGCEESKLLYCWPCVLSRDEDNYTASDWNETGVDCSLLKDFKVTANYHQISHTHIKATEVWKSILKHYPNDTLICSHKNKSVALFIRGDYVYKSPAKHNIQNLLELGPIKNNEITVERLKIYNIGQPKPPIAISFDEPKDSDVYYKCLGSNYYHKQQWLAGCYQEEQLYCWPCLLFSSNSNQWNLDGSKKVKCYLQRIKDHMEIPEHIKCIQLYELVYKLQSDPNTRNKKLKIINENCIELDELHEEIDIKDEIHIDDETQESNSCTEVLKGNPCTSTIVHEVDPFETCYVEEDFDMKTQETNEDEISMTSESYTQIEDESLQSVSMTDEAQSSVTEELYAQNAQLQNSPLDVVTSDTNRRSTRSFTMNLSVEPSLNHNPNAINNIDKLLKLERIEDRKPFPQELLDIIKQGRPTPQLPKFVLVTEKNYTRYDPFDTYMYNYIDFLTGCPIRNRLYCWPCLLFGKIKSNLKSNLIVGGIDTVRNLSSKTRSHSQTLCHKYAVEALKSVNKLLDTNCNFIITREGNGAIQVQPYAPIEHVDVEDSSTHKSIPVEEEELIVPVENVVFNEKTTDLPSSIKKLSEEPFKLLNKISLQTRIKLLKLGKPSDSYLKLKHMKKFVARFDEKKNTYLAWLTGPRNGRRFYCWPCLLFAKEKTNWNSVGIGNVKYLPLYVSTHNSKSVHTSAVSLYKKVMNLLKVPGNFEKVAKLLIKESGSTMRYDKSLEIEFLLESTIFDLLSETSPESNDGIVEALPETSDTMTETSCVAETPLAKSIMNKFIPIAPKALSKQSTKLTPTTTDTLTHSDSAVVETSLLSSDNLDENSCQSTQLIPTTIDELTQTDSAVVETSDNLDENSCESDDVMESDNFVPTSPELCDLTETSISPAIVLKPIESLVENTHESSDVLATATPAATDSMVNDSVGSDVVVQNTPKVKFNIKIHSQQKDKPLRNEAQTVIQCIVKVPFDCLDEAGAKERIEWFKMGRPTPDLPELKSISMEDGKVSRLQFETYHYNMNAWLTGCTSDNGLYCWVCLLFGKSYTKWNSKGHHTLPNLPICLGNHSVSDAHVAAVELYYKVDKFLKQGDKMRVVEDLLLRESHDYKKYAKTSQGYRDSKPDNATANPSTDESVINKLLASPFWKIDINKIPAERISILKSKRPVPKVEPNALKGLFSKFPWLTWHTHKQKVFCWPCLLFNRIGTVWNTRGYTAWENFEINCMNHEKCASHAIASDIYKQELRKIKNMNPEEDSSTTSTFYKLSPNKIISKLIETPFENVNNIISPARIAIFKMGRPVPTNLQCDLYAKYAWIVRCYKNHCHFCWPCLLFGTKQTDWNITGIKWNDEKAFKDHDTNPLHLTAMKIYVKVEEKISKSSTNCDFNWLVTSQDTSDDVDVVPYTPYIHLYLKEDRIQSLLDMPAITNIKINTKRQSIALLGPPDPIFSNIWGIDNQYSWLNTHVKTHNVYCWYCLYFKNEIEVPWNITNNGSNKLKLVLEHSEESSHKAAKTKYNNLMTALFKKLRNNKSQVQSSLAPAHEGVQGNSDRGSTVNIHDVEECGQNQGNTETSSVTPTKEEKIILKLSQERFTSISGKVPKDRLVMLKEGRPKPKIPLTVTVTNVDGKKVTKKLSSDIYTQYEWITACTRRKRLFCWPCLLFSREFTPWAKYGCSYNLTDTFEQLETRSHEDTEGHLTAVWMYRKIKLMMKNSKKQDIEVFIDSEHEKDQPWYQLENRDSINQLIKTPYSCLSNTVPTERINLINLDRPTPPLPEIISELDVILGRYTYRYYEIKPWITGCFITKQLYCWYCLLFSPVTNPWSLVCDNCTLGGVLEQIGIHDASTQHLQASVLFNNIKHFIKSYKSPALVEKSLTALGLAEDSVKNSLAKEESIPTLLKTPFKDLDYEIPRERQDLIKLGRPMYPVVLKLGQFVDELEVFYQFNPQRLHYINWLAGCKETNKIYCWPCLLFNTESEIWNTEGIDSLLILNRDIHLHSISLNHKIAVKLYKIIKKFIENPNKSVPGLTVEEDAIKIDDGLVKLVKIECQQKEEILFTIDDVEDSRKRKSDSTISDVEVKRPKVESKFNIEFVGEIGNRTESLPAVLNSDCCELKERKVCLEEGEIENVDRKTFNDDVLKLADVWQMEFETTSQKCLILC